MPSEPTREAEREMDHAKTRLLRAAYAYGDAVGNGSEGLAALARALRAAATEYAHAVDVHEQEAEADTSAFGEEADIPF